MAGSFVCEHTPVCFISCLTGSCDDLQLSPPADQIHDRLTTRHVSLPSSREAEYVDFYYYSPCADCLRGLVNSICRCVCAFKKIQLVILYSISCFTYSNKKTQTPLDYSII